MFKLEVTPGPMTGPEIIIVFFNDAVYVLESINLIYISKELTLGFSVVPYEPGEKFRPPSVAWDAVENSTELRIMTERRSVKRHGVKLFGSV